MQNWREIFGRLQAQATKIPKLFWAVLGVAAASLAVVAWFEFSGPPYTVLSEGLSPADGGKVIAQLQKLGIPYQLQAAGNVILVPAPQLAQARLQLGAAQVPGTDSQTAWAQLETAPMTTSDLAQSAMATQALQISLQQSISAMAGIRSAQVFLALPPETPFLADQPKAAASVVVDADPAQAAQQGEAIAKLIAGAVPGLAAGDVTVVTTAGNTIYPAADIMKAGMQFSTAAQIEASSAARVATLLMPLVGAGNFQTNVSANLDFTQAHIHETSYGPGHFVQHSSASNSTQTGSIASAIGIPGALSNEPPGQTNAGTPQAVQTAAPPTAQTPTANEPGRGQAQPNAQNTATNEAKPQLPSKTTNDLDQNFANDQTESDITKPDWAVKSIAVSVVLNQSALPSNLTMAQIKTAISSSFAYPDVTVSVLAVPFQKPSMEAAATPLVASATPLAHALLEVLAALALLFGFALPAGRRLTAVNIRALLPAPPPTPRPIPVVLPPRDFSELREQAAENIPGVARLLQSWTEEND